MINPGQTIVSLKSANPQTLAQWYTELLGKDPKASSGAYFFDLPGCSLVIWRQDDREPGGDGAVELCLTVDDLAASHAAVAARFKPSGIHRVNHGSEFFLRDPDHNRIIIYQMGG